MAFASMRRSYARDAYDRRAMAPRPSLRDVLLDHLSAKAKAELADDAEVEDILRRHLEAARHAWPRLALAEESFVAHVARGVPDDRARAALRGLHASDLFLA